VLTAATGLWVLQVESAQWAQLSTLNGPTPRAYGHLFPSAARDQLVLFGGMHGSQMYRDLWRYDLSTDTWAELTDGTRPGARFGSATCADDLGAAYAFGGSFNDQMDYDIWRYGDKHSIHDLVSQIQFSMDSATLSGLWGAVFATLNFAILATATIVFCVRNCRGCRRRRAHLPMHPGTSADRSGVVVDIGNGEDDDFRT
jgi:hypothetical protein